MQGFPFPASLLYSKLQPWPFLHGHKGMHDASSCIVVHLATGDLQLLERPHPDAFSSAGRLVPGILPCPSPARLNAVSRGAQAGWFDLGEKVCFPRTCWTQGLLAACWPPQPAFSVVQAKDFTCKENLLMLRLFSGACSNHGPLVFPSSWSIWKR